MFEEIIKNLYKIEEEENVKIIYAAESGSRAWGFESINSDYDIRFIYIRPIEWYLSIEDKRDVIEKPITGKLDISGWDIRKALYLLRKFNPPLIEWLQSPTIYIEKYDLTKKMRSLVEDNYSPTTGIYHYLNIASGNFREYLKSDEVRIKKYFYVLRPIFACLWIEKFGTAPPMEFQKLLDAQNIEPELLNEIEKLLQRKKTGEEMNLEPRVDIINQYLEKQLLHLSSHVTLHRKSKLPDIDIYNQLFRDTLEEVWRV
jgi:predicted nucleotidyltransferase